MKAFLQHTRTGDLGTTSADNKFTVIEVECLGACGFATPVMINEEFIESVPPETVPANHGKTSIMGYPHTSHQRETRYVSRIRRRRGFRSLDGWKKRGGYQALEKALAMTPGDIVNVVKDQDCAGAGSRIPNRLKWSFMKPAMESLIPLRNADESVARHVKDREIRRWTPHALVEGCAIGAYAIGAETHTLHPR